MNSDTADTQPPAAPAAAPAAASSPRRRTSLIALALLAAIGAGVYQYWRMQQQPVPGFEPLPEPEHALATPDADAASPADARPGQPSPGRETPPAELPATSPVAADAPLPLPAPAVETPSPAPVLPTPTVQPERPDDPRAGVTAALQVRVTELEAAVAALAMRETPGTSAGQLVLDEVAGLVALAEQRLQLARDVAGAASALRLALTRLSGGGEFTSLRDALVDDSAALGAFRDVDVAALAAELATLARRAPGFALAGPPPPAAAAPAAAATGWRGLLLAVWQSLRSLVEVRDAAEAADPLLNPAHAALARQQLALDLSAARIAVLLREAGGLRAALDPAITQLERHFDGGDPAVRAALTRLREIAGLDIAPALPSLARSLDALGRIQREERAP